MQILSEDPVVPLKYGSTIIFSLPDFHRKVLSADGFIKPSLTISTFEDQTQNNLNEKYQDFSNSLFKIMPFSSYDNFKWKLKVLNEFLNQDTAQKIKLDNEKRNSKERKKDFEELLQSFDLELNSNLGIYEKMKGSPLLFESSVFQLLHVETLKMLSLNTDNPNDIK